MASEYERYDHGSGEFAAWPEPDVFDLLDYAQSRPIAEVGHVPFCDVGIHDIPATMHRALGQLKEKWSFGYARIRARREDLPALATSAGHIGLVFDATMSAIEMTEGSFEDVASTGVAGLIIKPDVPGPEVLQGLPPETLILRRVISEV